MTREETLKRREEVKRMRESGMTFEKIGRKLGGVTREHAWKIYQSATQFEKYRHEIYRIYATDDRIRSHVHTRTMSALLAAGIHTVEDLKAIEPEDMIAFRDVGKRAIAEIEWLKNEVAHG